MDLKGEGKTDGSCSCGNGRHKIISFAMRRSQKHTADNSSVHKDTAWGDPQHAWIPHGSGVRVMDMGLGMFSLTVLVRGGGGMVGWI